MNQEEASRNYKKAAAPAFNEQADGNLQVKGLKISSFFRRFAEHCDNQQRMDIAAGIDTGGRRMAQICDAIKEYAMKAMGGAVLTGDNWRQESNPV